jgi:hypothetical protein
LELRVWVEYCLKTPENAERFIVDAARDMDDLLAFVPASQVGGLSEFYKARDGLTKRLAPNDSSARYTKVETAAKEISQHSLFQEVNRVQSKVAHPTALMVMVVGGLGKRERSVIRDVITKPGADMVRESIKLSKEFGEREAPDGGDAPAAAP